MGLRGKGKGDLYMNSHIHKMTASGYDTVKEVSHVVSSSVHALMVPVANAYHETKTTITEPLSMKQRAYHLLVWGTGGWLTYTLVGSMFPREKRMLESGVARAWKRLR